MKLATHAAPDVSQDLQWRLTYGLLLPLFVISEGVTRLYDPLRRRSERTRCRSAAPGLRKRAHKPLSRPRAP